MGTRLPVYPESFPQFDYTITLTGREYLLRWTWIERSASWELDIMQPDGTPLAMGRRVTTATNILARDRDPRLPPGIIAAVALDGELRDIAVKSDLGSVVMVVYFEPGELVADAVTPLQITIDIPS